MANEKKYKLYLASGIRLWTLFFKDKYAPHFNKKVDLFQPALIDKQYTRDHRLIPIRIATKDVGEINKSDAVLAYMKMYDTQDNGPAGTDSTWECGYAIGNEKPTIMLVEDLEHLDYYTAQWMVTFSIGAILTTSKEVADFVKNSDKFTHTAILYCQSEKEFEDKIIEYLDNYYKSIYAREGVINYRVDEEIRAYAKKDNIIEIFNSGNENGSLSKKYQSLFDNDFKEVLKIKNFSRNDFVKICDVEFKRAKIIKEIINSDYNSVVPCLKYCISTYLKNFEGNKNINDVAKMVEYWLSIPAQEIKGRKQGKKKTRPTIFYELYDLVSHHIVMSERFFPEDFVYKIGAVIEVYNWLNTYAIDDVFDNSSTRQGHNTLHVQYQSRRNAILLGSIGHCLSLLLLHQLTAQKPEVGKKLIYALNDVQYVMYRGQIIDIDLTFDNEKKLKAFVKSHNLRTAITKYFSRIYGICGSFYEEIGRMAVKSTNVAAQFYNAEEAEQACIIIAKLFGQVQMIRNDLGDLIFPEQLSKMGKGLKDTSHNDVIEGKLTLPIIYALFNEKTDKNDKDRLIKFLVKGNLSPKEKLEVSRIIWESGAIEYCMQFVELYAKLVREQFVRHISETPTRLKWIIKLMDVTTLINISFRQLAIDKKWRKLEPQILDDDLVEKIFFICERNNFLKEFINENRHQSAS
ncbi:MAG: polyprenyl synthetase family protein [Candidatus Buchananbacteria bacterium]